MAQRVGRTIQAINCPHCGAENEDYRKTCSQCGRSLAQVDKRPPKTSSSSNAVGIVVLLGTLACVVLGIALANGEVGMGRELAARTPAPTPIPTRPPVSKNPARVGLSPKKFWLAPGDPFEVTVWLNPARRPTSNLQLFVVYPHGHITPTTDIRPGEYFADDSFETAILKDGRNSSKIKITIHCNNLCFEDVYGTIDVAIISFETTPVSSPGNQQIWLVTGQNRDVYVRDPWGRSNLWTNSFTDHYITDLRFKEEENSQ